MPKVTDVKTTINVLSLHLKRSPEIVPGTFSPHDTASAGIRINQLMSDHFQHNINSCLILIHIERIVHFIGDALFYFADQSLILAQRSYQTIRSTSS